MDRAHRLMFGYMNAVKPRIYYNSCSSTNSRWFSQSASRWRVCINALERFAFFILSKEITTPVYLSSVKIRMKSYPVLNVDPKVASEPIDEGCLATGVEHALLYRTLVTSDCVEED